tara:strand:+ start:108 stop:722 length:615 start_codon:yes stop_codon:yes gene_type:complete
LNQHSLKKDLFNITSAKEKKFNKFIYELKNYNKKTNLVGRSTLTNPWNSHIIDSVQITSFIKNKNSSILDLGTGAGLPGIVLAIMGYKNVSVVDSNNKKINFIKGVQKKLNLNLKVFLSRIEKIEKKSYEYLTSRALAKLNKLFTYSQNLSNKDTVLIFLKGKTVNDEINEAKMNWVFDFETKQSYSDPRGKILIVKNLMHKHD